MLSLNFYKKYSRSAFPQVLSKKLRPYCMLLVKIEANTFAIPLRSKVSHKDNGLLTNQKEKSGLDYSKAVIVNNLTYIDTSKDPYVKPLEFSALKGKEYIIQKGMGKFINKYKKAYSKRLVTRNFELCNCSSLKYFHKELGMPKYTSKQVP